MENSFLNESIDILNLSTRAKHSIWQYFEHIDSTKRNDLTIKDLKIIDFDELMNIKNVGAVTVDEIKTALKRIGILSKLKIKCYIEVICPYCEKEIQYKIE